VSTAQRPRDAGSAFRRFLDSEAVGGMLLIGAAAIALLMVNSPLAPLYQAILHFPVGPVLAAGAMDVHHWINDGLMAVFFLLVGLEIKRELVEGAMATWQQRRLPAIAAAAGMAAPALVYLLFATGPGLTRGWAIPAATDIAFALGVLALLGKRAPASLKLFLTAVAIVDDMGAVAIIALFYTASLDPVALGAAAAILGAMFALGRLGVRALSPFLLLAAGLWMAILLSGIHPTVAGVLAACFIPVTSGAGAAGSVPSPLHKLEQALAVPVALFVLPAFGFANAGISLAGISLASLLAPLPLGVAAGLFLGKQIGVFAAIWLCIRFRLVGMFGDASWLQVYGLCLLCGIGFTMSLFISTLAFADPAQLEQAKLGILAGSLLSALAGFGVLRLARPVPPGDGA
jgi:NhaA family Na+:H+ antiporter